MDSRWPKDLLRSSTGPNLREILEDQANGIAHLTEGKVLARIDPLIIDSREFGYSFFLHPRGKPNYAVELFRVHSPTGGFPCSVRDFLNTQNDTGFDDPDSFLAGLSFLFDNNGTRSIVQTFAAEARPNDPRTPGAYQLGGLLSKLDDGTEYVAIDINGIAGFILRDQVIALSRQSTEPGSSYYEMPNGKIVVTLAVASTIKFTVERQDADFLAEQASLLLRPDQRVSE